MLQLPGPLLLAVHMSNFSPVVDFFVDFGNFTNEENSHTFDRSVAKAKCFCQKSLVPVTGLECSYGEIFIPVAEISTTEPAHPLILTKNFTRN